MDGQAKDAAEAKEKKEQDAKVAAKLVQLKEGLKFAALNKDGVQELYAKLDGRKGGECRGVQRAVLGVTGSCGG